MPAWEAVWGDRWRGCLQGRHRRLLPLWLDQAWEQVAERPLRRQSMERQPACRGPVKSMIESGNPAFVFSLLKGYREIILEV